MTPASSLKSASKRDRLVKDPDPTQSGLAGGKEYELSPVPISRQIPDRERPVIEQ